MTRKSMKGRRPPSRRTHGHSFVNGKASPEYNAWASMKGRCLNEKTPNYSRYGGRGISICQRWLTSFENFLEDMGTRPSPSHSLDRINNDGDYSAENCRWATVEQQQRNKSNVGIVIYRGRRMTVPELANEVGVPLSRLKTRLRRGWAVERAIK